MKDNGKSKGMEEGNAEGEQELPSGGSGSIGDVRGGGMR